MDKQISRQYFNNKASEWDETMHNNDQQKIRALAGRLTFPPDGWVLDVGTGTGVFVPYIQSRLNGNGQIVCVDFAFRMLEIAQGKNGSDGVDYVCAEIESAGLSGGKFDAVVCYSTFPHFHDQQQALKTMLFLLRPGGKMFICHTASREKINNIHRRIPDLEDHLIPEDDQMREMLADAGFGEVDLFNTTDSYLVEAKKPINL